MFLLREAQTCQDHLDLALIPITASQLKGLQRLPVALHGPFALGGVGHLLFQAAQLGLLALQVGEDGQHLLVESALAWQLCRLGQIADAQLSRPVHPACRRGIQAGYDAQQRRLARAVVPYQSDLVAPGDLEENAPEDILRAVGFGQLISRYNRHLSINLLTPVETTRIIPHYPRTTKLLSETA